MTKFIVPKLKVPFQMRNGQAEYVEQDSPEEIRQCVEAVVRTRVGHRIDDPEFGIPDPTLREVPVERGEIQRAISEQEPRALHVIREDEIEDLVSRVHIDLANQETTNG